MSNKQYTLYGLGILALALQITAISTESWSEKSADGQEAHFGLWKACDDKDCSHLPPSEKDDSKFPKNSLYAVRAFAIMGVIFMFIGLSCMMYMKNNKRCQLMCFIASGISSLIAMAIWAGELKKIYANTGDVTKVDFDLGYSFYLNLVGGLIALATAFYYYYY